MNNLIPQLKASKNLYRLFIISLFFTFLVATGSLILKYSITKKLDKLSREFREPSKTQDISNILIDLNTAENDFQQAGLYHEPQKLNDYKNRLTNIFSRIEGILKDYQADSARYFPGSRQQISASLKNKLMLSEQVLVLKKSFDSLLKVTTIEGINVSAPSNQNVNFQFKRQVKVKQSADTTVTVNKNKNGFFKRLRDAIANKNQATTRTLTIRRERQIKDSVTNALNKKHEAIITDLLKKLNEKNNQLIGSNKRLVAANLDFVSQIRELLKQLRDIDLGAWIKDRSDILKQYQAATDEMNTFTGIAIIVVLLFIPLLIVFIFRARTAEQNYLTENERAVALASQKSEILATMSHEIRNPLTVINGAIYMLNKTPLTDDQQKKIAAIKHSSAMLMGTINNILDAGKMENQQTDVLTITSFNPGQEIREAVEAVKFMAENKELDITANVTGDEQTLIKGDAFRLKQVMVNLLSNAIKYTDTGSVTVQAVITRLNTQKVELQVSVIDTGVGIPKEKQDKLFTRYYQANQAGRKPGTGLGLYICREIINLQKGSIDIESEAGRGCCIRFKIAYEKAEA
ncbi:signal transduction histidine kinase [Mucilaginibacter oryzae]|uniref:histidine kinase n=1 Tax=Mucilaginibacter oryzae TaxID=468058 RepID=A0A316HD39_9SPHI|nr:HAMP domain-containing sensor histidine kinase [Mucilaginibacter oryzae]PWK78438.1 signal transduction histidine kinase [Mucilaginibacter oryzae]